MDRLAALLGSVGVMPSLAAQRVVEFDLLIRDVRHMRARAAPDLADWLVQLDLEGKADRTIYGYHRYIAQFLRLFPDKQLSEFTHTDVNDLLRVTPKNSRHIVRSVVNGWFEWAMLDERIDRNPCARVPRMPNPKRRPRDIFSDAELALLEGLPSPDGELWTLLFGSGLRRGEARRLRWKHVDLNRAHLIVYGGKGDKDRIVPLPITVLSALTDLEKLEGLDAEDHLWYSLPGGGKRKSRVLPIGDTTFEHWYRRGIEATGVRYLSPHTTRHTYGWRIKHTGKFDLEERALIMGHENPNTTKRYYPAVSIEDLGEKMATVDW